MPRVSVFRVLGWDNQKKHEKYLETRLVPEHPEQMNKDVATEPTSPPEPGASPRVQMLVMDLGPCV